MTRVNLNDGTQPTPLSTEERHLDVIQELVEERDRLRAKLRASEAEVARLTRELEDVRKLLTELAHSPGAKYGDQWTTAARRAAVEYLEKESKDV